MAVDTLLTWSNSYFTHFNVLFPVLSRHHFMVQLVQSRQELDPALRYAVFGAGCHYLNPQNPTARDWLNQCQAILLDTHDRSFSLSTVQVG